MTASRLKWRLPAAALLLLAVSGCGRNGSDPEFAQTGGGSGELPERLDYLVRVGDAALSEEEFIESIPDEFKGLLTLQEKRGYVDRWVDTELLYEAAKDRGVLDDPDLRRRLEQQRREYVANYLLQKVLNERVVITEGEIADYYAEHLGEYSSEYRYREIVVRSQQEAEDLYQRLTSNAISFTRAAERHSLASSARMGGDMGWLAKGAMPPEVEERIVRMKPAEISKPFETAWGWTLIQFRERRESDRALDLQDVRDEILRYLTMSRRRQVYAEFLDEVQQSYVVHYHPELEQRLRSDEFVPAGRLP